MTTENTTPPVDETPEPEPILSIDLPDGATALSALGSTDKILVFPAGGGIGTITKDKFGIVPYSLSEQIVPGEFWIGADGVSRQVYQRTFKGVTEPTGSILEGMTITELMGGVKQGCIYTAEVLTGSGYNETNGFIRLQVDPQGNMKILSEQASMGTAPYSITIKYTKI